ncbi:MAG: zinc-ribbon domain-containing protein [Thermoplasmata archaeon]|nr:zinc-ribbon domain-containing protein [Thermoplasmata archaeon]
MRSSKIKVCRICTAVLGDDEFCPICGTPSREPKKGSRPSVPRAEPLPEFDESTGSCLVCGIPLRGGICEMCGSPRMSVKDKELEFRCPFCEEPVDPNATRCPHCGIDYVSREKEKDINYRCPMCGEVASLLEDKCSSCGIEIWLDFESERRSITKFLCPMCGEEIDPDSETCPKCGTGVWIGEEDVKESAAAAIDSASTSITEETSKVPSTLARAEVVLVSAKEAFDNGDYLAANRAANLSAEIAKTTVLQTKIFQEAVRRAQSRITYLDEKGGDTSDAIDLLKRAVKVRQTGNIRGAVRLAIKSRIRAEEAIPAPMLSEIDLE